jgi:hypothetical protein
MTKLFFVVSLMVLSNSQAYAATLAEMQASTKLRATSLRDNLVRKYNVSKDFLVDNNKAIASSTLGIIGIKLGDKIAEMALTASATASIAGQQLDRVDHTVVEKAGHGLIRSGRFLRSSGITTGRAVRLFGTLGLVYGVSKMSHYIGNKQAESACENQVKPVESNSVAPATTVEVSPETKAN